MADEWVKVEQSGMHDFEEDSELVGTLISVKHGVGQNESIVYNIKKEDNMVVGMWGSTVLDDRMASVAIGQKVKIVYHGKQKTKSGRSAKMFDVYYGKAPEKDGGEK